jgi:hypothetical protein
MKTFFSKNKLKIIININTLYYIKLVFYIITHLQETFSG